MITKSTIPSHEWCEKNNNYEMDLKSFGKETVAVIAAISSEYGIDHIEIYDRSVNIPKFK